MDRKHLLTLVIFSLAAFILAFRYPGESKLEWKDWDEGYVEAKKSHKILLIDTYTDWCGWCKKMDADTYTKEKVISYINKYFIPVKFNPELKKKYHIGENEVSGRELLASLSGGQGVGYPTTFFLSLDKNQVQMVSGYKNAEDFMTVLQEKVNWGNSK
ncbi:DUF255 domain-containing protein [bacterium]|nr:DUF255 domain-containing protein [bacterium]